MVDRWSVAGLGLLALLAGCQSTGTTEEQKSTAAATGAGIGQSTGDGFVDIVGDGVVGGGAGDLGGQSLEVDEFRDPRFGRTGSLR